MNENNGSKALNIFKRLLAPLSGIIVCIILILCFANNPGSALNTFFTGAFTSKYYFGNMLNTAAFLMLAGTGAAISVLSGNMNLGGEGQIYLGGFIGCIILNSMKGPAALVFATALLCSILSSALLAMISALLKELRGAEVLLTSFLISAACIPLIDGFITASKAKSESMTNMLSLPYIEEKYRLTQLLSPSPLTVAIIIGVLVCLLAWLFITKTSGGKKLIIWGKAPLFARYCGYNSLTVSYGSLFVSGALHGLTGFFAVCGTYYTCHKDFYSGMGWNALAASLIASSNPLALLPVSLVLGWLYTSADRVALTQSFSFDIEGIIQGVILFAIAIPVVTKKLSHNKKENAE